MYDVRDYGDKFENSEPNNWPARPPLCLSCKSRSTLCQSIEGVQVTKGFDSRKDRMPLKDGSGPELFHEIPFQDTSPADLVIRGDNSADRNVKETCQKLSHTLKRVCCVLENVLERTDSDRARKNGTFPGTELAGGGFPGSFRFEEKWQILRDYCSKNEKSITFPNRADGEPVICTKPPPSRAGSESCAPVCNTHDKESICESKCVDTTSDCESVASISGKNEQPQDCSDLDSGQKTSAVLDAPPEEDKTKPTSPVKIAKPVNQTKPRPVTTSKTKPETSSTKEETSKNKPETSKIKPVTSKKKPDTNKDKSETSKNELEARKNSPKPSPIVCFNRNYGKGVNNKTNTPRNNSEIK